MSKRLLCLSLCIVLAAGTPFPVMASPVTGPGSHSDMIIPWPSQDRIKAGCAALSPALCVFTENGGQVENQEILYYSQSGSIAFARGNVFLYSRGGDGSGPGWDYVVKLSFPGSNDAAPVGRNQTAGSANFLNGPDPGKWRTGVRNYQAVAYKNIWDGIDLEYRLEGGSVKYEFLVRPCADPSEIKVKAEGIEGLRLSDDGISFDLGPAGSMSDSGLDVYYLDNRSEKIGARFALEGHDTYSFALSEWDSSRAAVIDPLIYSTYLGGGGFDHLTDVAVGPDGCAYVTGYTDSADFPTTLGVYDSELDVGSIDIFVVKMGLNGDALVYSTFIGAESHDYAQAIAVDSAGHAYVTGYTMSYGFPTTQDAFDRTYNGDSYDSFVFKLSESGDSLAYSSMLGGRNMDFGSGIALDKEGFAYILGETWSPDFPISTDAVQRTLNAGLPGAPDLFITKVGQMGDSLAYSTFLGHDDFEKGGDIAVDGNGYAYITGQTRSAMFPVTQRAFDRTHNGGFDAFVVKLSQSATSLMYSTFLGGGESEYGQGIAVGAWGHAYVTGITGSSDFPTTGGAYDETHNGGNDVFVTMIDRYGESMAYSTFLGGSSNEQNSKISLDNAGNACVGGTTSSADFPMTQRSYDSSFNGLTDAFVSKLSQSGGVLLDSTFLGSPGADSCVGFSVGEQGFAYVAGETQSAEYPVTAGCTDAFYSGNTDCFVTKLDVAPPVADAGPDMRINEGQTATFNGAGSTDNHGIVNYTWTFFSGIENITLYGLAPQYAFPVPGIYTVTLNVTDATGYWAADAMVLTVVDITYPVALAGPDLIADEDKAVKFNATASSDNVGIVNYTWSFSEGYVTRTLFGETATYIFATPGTYTVTLDIWDAAGNWARDTLVAQINDITAPTAQAGPDRSIYRGNETWFDGAASRDNVDIVNYTWRFSDGIDNFVLEGAQAHHLFTVPGIFQVELTVADTSGLRGTDTMVLTVLETVKPVADAGQDMTVNEAGPAHFDGSGCSDNVGVASWVWAFNDGLNDITLFGERPSWIFTVPGIYVVTLNASDAAGNWDIDTLNVTVLDTLLPVAAPGPDHLIMPHSVVYFDGSGSHDSSGITNYTWAFVYNGTDTALFGKSQSFTFWTEGTYTVTLTVLDANGNSASARMTVTVTEPEAASAGWSDSYGWFLVLPACMMFTAAVALYLRRRMGAAEP